MFCCYRSAFQLTTDRTKIKCHWPTENMHIDNYCIINQKYVVHKTVIIKLGVPKINFLALDGKWLSYLHEIENFDTYSVDI